MISRLLIAGTLCATAATVCGEALAQSRTLTVSWWGFNGDKLNEYIVEPFERQCGCELIFETGNNADRLNKIRIRNGEGVDVAYFTDAYTQIGIEEGLFQPVDRSKIPNLDGIYDMAKAPHGDYGPGYTIGRVGVIYDSAAFQTPITKWTDIWRDDVRGKLSLPNITTTAGPMVVMIAGKISGTDPFANPDRVFAEISRLKESSVKNYNTGSELVNLFSTGEISISITQDFVLRQVQAALPTAVWATMSDGEVAVLNTINIAKGSKNVDLAHEFINFVLDPKVQQTLAENGVDAPVVKSVTLTPEQAKQWTYGADMIEKLQTVDYEKMNAAKLAWIDHWNEIFGM